MLGISRVIRQPCRQQVACGCGLQGRNDGFQCLAVLGEPVFDTRWHLRIDGAGHQTIMFKLAQLVGEHALRDVGQHALQCIEAKHLPGKQMVEDDPLPLAADQVQCGFHRTAGGTVESGVWCSCHGSETGSADALPCERWRCPSGMGACRPQACSSRDAAIPPCRAGAARKARIIASRCMDSIFFDTMCDSCAFLRDTVVRISIADMPIPSQGDDHESHRFQPAPAHFR